ncbi:MAG: hypothetical protein ACTSV1_06400 [Alphaproteobacteria bacterium]
MNIPIPDKNNWPETADGVTDWQKLFDDETDGLIAVVSAAQTPVQLKQQTEIIIRQIFSRESDRPVIGKAMGALDRLIPENAGQERLAVMLASVIKMFEKAKENRIHRAAVFVEKEKERIAREKQAKQKKSPAQEQESEQKKADRRPGFIIGFFRRNMDILALILGLFSRVKGGGEASAKEGAQESTKEDGEEVFFKQDAYVHDGDGDTEWQDNDMYAMKEKETEPVFKDDEETKEEEDDEYDSWDNY